MGSEMGEPRRPVGVRGEEDSDPVPFTRLQQRRNVELGSVLAPEGDHATWPPVLFELMLRGFEWIAGERMGSKAACHGFVRGGEDEFKGFRNRK
jgi:hypothetical protein